MERYVRDSGLEPLLFELISIRAAQLNGCAFSVDMHHHDARRFGEDQHRLDLLPGWRDASPAIFTERERAALALTEAVTRIDDHGVSDRVWDEVSTHFRETEVVQLLMVIATANVWNRLAVATRQELLTFRP